MIILVYVGNIMNDNVYKWLMKAVLRLDIKQDCKSVLEDGKLTIIKCYCYILLKCWVADFVGFISIYYIYLYKLTFLNRIKCLLVNLLKLIKTT